MTAGDRLLRPLRVRVVSPAGVLGGAEHWLLAALDHTDRWDVDVVLLADGPLRTELERRGIPVRLLPVGGTAVAVAAAVARLGRLLREDRPDVVLANGVKSAMVAGPAGPLVGVPVVWVKHDHSYDAWAAKPLGMLCTRVVATAEEVAVAVGREDTAVVTPPRPDPPLERVAARAEWRAHGLALDDRPTVVALGRVVPYKGIDDAVRALALPGGAGWRLVIVGDDDPSAPGTTVALLELARALGVAERVQHVAAVPGAARLLAAFDALVVLTKPTNQRRTPSREGFGATALEAMTAGVPVVAVEGGAVVRRLAERAGLPVRPGDPAGVADALGRLTPEVRAQMGAAGRELAAHHPGAGDLAERVTQVLAQAAGRPGAGLRTGPAMTVVVPVRDDAAPLAELLFRLVPQLRSDDAVLVVDGGRDAETEDLLAGWTARDPRVSRLAAPGTNIPQARNLAWSRVATEWVAATDAGCVPVPGWLDALRAAAADGAPALVTGVYRVEARSPFEAAMAAACYPDPDEVGRPTGLLRVYGALLGRAFDPALPTNRSNAVPVAVAEAVGGYDEALATAEDVTFGRAVVAAGGRAVLSREAEVSWQQRPTLRATARMYRSYGRGDGLSGDRTLIARDLVRLLAYTAGPLLLASPRPGVRALASTGAAAYLSLPVARALRREHPLRTAALVPAALGLKDVAKAVGCGEGVLAQQRGRRS